MYINMYIYIICRNISIGLCLNLVGTCGNPNDLVMTRYLWHMESTSVEVKLAVTHHSISASNDSFQLESQKPLTFCLDEPKQPSGKKTKKRKKGGSGFNAKNFGSIVDISTLKNANRIMIGWRARCPWGTTKCYMIEVWNLRCISRECTGESLLYSEIVSFSAGQTIIMYTSSIK